MPGVKISDLGTDVPAKARWNYYLLQQDQSFGINNPDFTFQVVGNTQLAVDSFVEP